MKKRYHLIIGIIIVLILISGWWFLNSKTSCTQDAASYFLSSGQGSDPCNRFCESYNDCKWECGCECISKNEECIYTNIECEAPDPLHGCRCINNICKFGKLQE